MPAFINLSIELIRCHNQQFAHVEVVNERRFLDFVSRSKFPLHRAFHKLIDFHRADYFRCVVLFAYGGFYTDADAIAWNSVEPWFQKLCEGYDIFGCKWPGEVIGNAILGPVKVNNLLFEHWINEAHSVLDSKFTAFATASHVVGHKNL